MNIRQPVKVQNKEHPRFNQAGIVESLVPPTGKAKTPDAANVRFDEGDELEAVKLEDLKELR